MRRAAAGRTTDHLLRLVRGNDIRTPVLRPTLLVLAERHGLLSAETACLYLLVGNTRKHHRALYAVGTALPECKVVFTAATIIAIPLHRNSEVGMLRQEFCV